MNDWLTKWVGMKVTRELHSGHVAVAKWVMCCGMWIAATAVQTGHTMTLDELRVARRGLAHKARRIIANNDGCDCLYFPAKEEVTAKAFLDKRTTDMAGKQVDTIAYCSISSGFSHFTHNTKTGTVLTRQGKDYGIQLSKKNITQDLIDQGTDCLQLVVDYAHAKDMEAFWSMRMNDTHDVAHRPEKPYFLFPVLKEEHPEWLVGDPVKRTPHGRWSSVNYAVPEIRDLAFSYIEEVCRNYDVDGVELDFCRHLCYFPSTAQGGVASDEERATMTGLLRRIRSMTEKRGLARGRPVLISIRVPDSVDYCRDMGLDLEEWLGTGLVDLLITTCYFRLNPWSYSVELGRKYGVSVYPCLSDSRVQGESRFRRSSVEGYRGRALNAWASGASGIHLFNVFNPRSPIWEELGDLEVLARKTRLHFATVRDGDPRSFLANGRSYRNMPILTPSHPQVISGETPFSVPITVGIIPQEGSGAKVTCHVQGAGHLKPDAVAVELNGTVLQDGVVVNDWLDYSVPLSALKIGENRVSIRMLGVMPDVAEQWPISCSLHELPSSPWERDRGSKATVAELRDEGLFIADRGTDPGDYLYYRCAWGGGFSAGTVAEAEVKVISGESCIIIADGTSGERLVLAPDYITLWHARQHKHEMNTTNAFHMYRVEAKGSRLIVSVDGVPVLDVPDGLPPRPGYRINKISFGATNSGGLGEAVWRAVRARTSGIACKDAVLKVTCAE